MKTLRKLKLNQLAMSEIEDQKMNRLLGGQGDCSGSCACGCDYEGTPGGSSTSSNRSANNTDYTPYSGFNKEEGFWNQCIWHP